MFAYDFINRSKLWKRLTDIGVSGKLYLSIKSLYSSVSSCVRVNSLHTDWFDVNCGLRQGCILSPILFNLYINDLAVYLKSFGKGIVCDNDTICIMIYADDIVLLAESEHDLQFMLNALHDWCNRNDMLVNNDKSNIVHFRKQSSQKTNFTFKCGNFVLKIVDKYMYLGMLMTEHLDFETTAKHVAQSASRALGLLIARCKLAGGLPYAVFTKLYDSMVWPVIGYSACIWGYKQYSCITAVQNRAIRFFLGVGKYTPNAALLGEMGWDPSYIRQLECIVRHYKRISNTNASRLNKRIALWADSLASLRCKNWFYIVQKRILELGVEFPLDILHPISSSSICKVKAAAMSEFKAMWYTQINNIVGPSGRGRNKLRTYCLFKSEYKAEEYCKMILPLRHRAAFAKFRCGVAPLRLETGRYENLALENRICPFCDSIETEAHVILECMLYQDLRQILFSKATQVNFHFATLSPKDKLIFIFSNADIRRLSAKTCFNILQRRYFYLCI